MRHPTKTGAFLELGDAFSLNTERGVFFQWVGPATQTRWGLYRTAQVFNSDNRLTTWSIDQTAQLPIG